MSSKRRPAWLKPIVAGAADPAKMEAWAANLSPEAAVCRGKRGHLWTRKDCKPIKGGYFDLWWCPRCFVHQEYLLDSHGRVVEQSAPKYDKDYRAPRGAGRIEGEARDAFRLVGVLAFIEGKS